MSGPASNPQHILVTLLGTHFFGQQQPIPSGFLVDLLDEFGVSEIGARNALSRVTRRGLLEFSRSGRTTYYQLSGEAHRNHSARLSEILRGAAAPAWDGTWTVVLFSISEEQRPLRHVVRTRLTRLRFGMLYDGVWVRPGPTDSTAADMLQALRLQKATVLTTATTDRIFGIGDPINAFPLAEIDAGYKAFIASHSGLRDRMVAGEVGAAEALRARAAVMDQWRDLTDADPSLPAEILPAAWPKDEAHALFIDIHDGLAELADVRLRTLLSKHAPDLASGVRSPTSRDVRDPQGHLPGSGPLTGIEQVTSTPGQQ